VKVCVTGAAPPGSWLAVRSARAGHPTVLHDPDSSAPQAIRLAVERDHLPLRVVSRIEGALADADLVMDAAPDNRESKIEIFSFLDGMAPPHTIFLTPTHHVSIAELAIGTFRWERCFALEAPDADPESGNLPVGVTLVHPSVTDPKALSAVVDFLQSLGLALGVREDQNPIR